MDKEKNTESDLGLKNEMAFAISNLCNIEEHLSMSITAENMGNIIPIMEEIRKLRAKYMKKYIGKDLDGQLWCCVKHLLSTSYRLTEVATKNASLGKYDECVENLEDSKDLFQLSFVLIELGGKHGVNEQSEGKTEHKL